MRFHGLTVLSGCNTVAGPFEEQARPPPTDTVSRLVARKRVSTRIGKRALDLVIAVPLAVLSAPLLALLATGSAVIYRANPFFVHERLGRSGRPFRVVKLRSLPPSTPTDAHKYAIAEMPNHGWGQFLRRSRLDEVPQVWQVLAGSMSLVGPRPEMPSLAATYDPEFVAERLRVRPGCTGLGQVSPAATGIIGEHPEYDEHYVRYHTVRLDLWVLAVTVRVVLTRHGGNDLGCIPRWTGAAVAVAAHDLDDRADR